MEPRPEAGLPATLGRWVGEIVLSIRQPARRTVAELIVGGLLAGGGHVTQAFLALTPRLGWQAYHWMLERGRFRLLGLVAALCGVVRREGHGGRCFAIIDDTLAPRASAKAPGAAVRFDHAHKRNRPAFLLCQAFVRWAPSWPVAIGRLRAHRHRPVPRPGHAGKIALAKALLRAVGDRLGPLCLLLDAWYMRASLIQAPCGAGTPSSARSGATRRCSACRRPTLRAGVAARGCMARGSTPLPRPSCRPRRTASPATAAGQPVCATPCAVRGSCAASSPGGLVRVGQPQGGWAKQRLLLCTDLDLSAPAVVEAYAQRWSVEPLFAALKLTDGMGAMWQRGRRTLLRWLHLVQIGRALLVLLTARAEPEVLALLRVGGWRRPTTLTPGLVKDALARRFRDIQAFRLVPATHKKTGPARGPGPPVNATTA